MTAHTPTHSGAMAQATLPETCRLSDEQIDTYLPDHIQAAKRCGLERSEWLSGWFVSWSPRNDNQNAEGGWSDWVALANAILEADRIATASAHAALSEQEGSK